jgi:hypothetical protein
VLAFDSFQRPPLLYHAGRYALAVEKNPVPAAAHGSVTEPESLDHEFLFGMLGRAHNQMYQQIQTELGKWSLSDRDRSVLSVLGSPDHDTNSKAITHLIDAARAAESRMGGRLSPGEMQILKQLLRRLLGDS